MSHAIPPAACSNIEFASLELQRFLGLLKVGPIELHAKFVWPGSCCRLSNFARNSPAACSNIEFASLELQRFWAVLKSDRGKLCAKLIWRWLPRTCVGPANLPQPAPRPGPVVPSVPSAPVGPGVLLCRIARSLLCVRYKILPAWCCAEQSGTKLSLHAEKAPHRAISGVQGEYYTAHAVRRGERGEFCTGYVARVGVRGEFCTEGARCGCCWANNVVP